MASTTAARRHPAHQHSSSSSSSRGLVLTYRIRVTNNRQHDIKVLGRGWVIESHFGDLEGFVQLAADNGVVGQQPVIPP
ncbi:ApaG domain-containing protein, partial [Klebsiella pneumoniae]|uniref:ApaG domain-containing protein n=1 Tax=Klebsiella pneumoniae TaxID=573 RepID=UPI003390149C